MTQVQAEMARMADEAAVRSNMVALAHEAAIDEVVRAAIATHHIPLGDQPTRDMARNAGMDVGRAFAKHLGLHAAGATRRQIHDETVDAITPCVSEAVASMVRIWSRYYRK